MPDSQTLFAGAVIAAGASLPLALVFGFTRRTVLVAVGLAVAIAIFYPGGTTGLLVDALRPLRMLVQDARDRGAARDAAVGEAADGPAPPATR
ncbi:MAG TPA: hypothetical protein VKW76_16180 [Candidatus Binatia bacterium]|nr:hypothetical protein [Candidatus Binatia bacterium]